MKLLFTLIGAMIAASAAALDAGKEFGQYVRDRWSVQDGFPQVSALQVVQDHTGYIWASTQSGLARFDGERFVAFNLRNTPELLTDHLEHLAIDANGTLWIGSARGLTSASDGRFHIVARASEIGAVTALHAGAGQVLVGTESGLFQILDVPVERHQGRVDAVFASLETVTIASVGRLIQLRSGTFDVLSAESFPNDVTEVSHLAHWRDALWAGTNAGLRRAGALDEAMEVAALSGAAVEMLYVDRAGSLWVGTYPALVRLPLEGTVEVIDQSVFGFHPWIKSATEDHEGNLWLGSNTHSLIRVWDGWTRRYSASNGLDDPFVWSLLADGDGALWVGTNSGLSRLREGRVETIIAGSELPDPAVYTLADASDGCLWLGLRRGLRKLCSGEIRDSTELQIFSARQVTSILEVDEGTLIGTDGGLYLHDEDGARPIGAGSGSGGRVRVLTRGADGSVLVGTEEGLLILREQQLESAGNEVMAQAFITAISVLPGGEFAVGSLSRGIFVGSPGKPWRRIDVDRGLPEGAQFYMDAPGDGYLWVGGEVGAYRITLTDLTTDSASRLAVRNLASTNGLAGSEPARCCNGAGNAKGLHWQDAYWFPTLDGVLKIEPWRVGAQVRPTRTVVEQLNAGEARFSGQEPIVLKPSQRDFSIDFTALTFQDPRNVVFRYRLSGYDDDWVSAQRRRTAFYTNLRPGLYEFRVMASSQPGAWSDQSEPLVINIQPTLTETLWFRVAASTLMAALLGFGIFVRLRRADAARRRLEQLVLDRTADLDRANRLLREANSKLELASETDALTGLGNRRFVMNRLPASWGDPELEGGNRLLVVIDVDHFKEINDVHGHAVGDVALRQLANLLRKEIRDEDIALRWGGEEFVLIIGGAEAVDAPDLCERLRRAVENCRFDVGGLTLIRFTCSFGAAPLATGERIQPGDAFDLALELADRGLYASKQCGRNGWTILTGPMDDAGWRPSEQTPAGYVESLLQEDAVVVASSFTNAPSMIRAQRRDPKGGKGQSQP